MTYTWYIGTANARTIKAADWTGLGIANSGDTTWNPANTFSIDESTLSAGQIAFLTAQSDFVTGQATVRPGTATVVDPNAPVTQAQLATLMAGNAVGASLAYAEMATSIAGQALSNGAPWSDITGTPLAVAPVIGTRAVEVEANVVIQPNSANTITLAILDATSGSIVATAGKTVASGSFDTIRVKRLVTPGPGARAYRVQLKGSAAGGTATVYGLDVNTLVSSLQVIQR